VLKDLLNISYSLLSVIFTAWN